MKKFWEKYNLILFLGIIAWNIYVSLPKKENDAVNSELFQYIYKQSKQDMDRYWAAKVTQFEQQYEKDSVFMSTVTNEQLDSLELRYLNRGRN